MRRRKKILFAGAAICGVCLVTLYLLELLMSLGRPRNVTAGDSRTSWGIPVELNSDGFREREFTTKQPGVKRVLVLGDSFTWAPGIAIGDRYTEVTAHILGPGWEILNLGMVGYAAAHEADVLRNWGPQLQPDYVVYAFCINDVTTKAQNWSVERDRWNWLNQRHSFERIGLRWTGNLMVGGTFHLLEFAHQIPPWPESLDRLYDPNSVEWKAFTAAMQDIRDETKRLGAGRPIFISMNQGTSLALNLGGKDDYGHPSPLLKLMLKWYGLAEAEATRLGYQVINIQKELEAVGPMNMTVNRWDGHANKVLHAMYGKNLARQLSAADHGNRRPSFWRFRISSLSTAAPAAGIQPANHRRLQFQAPRYCLASFPPPHAWGRQSLARISAQQKGTKDLRAFPWLFQGGYVADFGGEPRMATAEAAKV